MTHPGHSNALRDRVGLALLNAEREWDEKPPAPRLSALNEAWAHHMADAALHAIQTFDGLMVLAQEILDSHYPADVPLVCDRDSPDPGPRLVAALRDCIAARAEA